VRAIAEVREFNRFYTGVIGVLRDGLLRTPYTLTEARVIFELAQRGESEVADVRRTLDLDPGYLSRILARFADDGLVRRRRADTDGRRQVVSLTEAGLAAWRTLDQRSSAEVAALLDRLAGDDRDRLLGAMAAIRDLLGGRAPRGGVVLREPEPGDLGWIVACHGALYAREYGYDETFEGLVAGIVADFAGHDPGRERAWIAEVDGVRAGSVLCARRDDTTAQLRLLLVEPAARGQGVGRRLVDECLGFARAAGYDRITLFTYDAHAGARRIYQRVGFTLAEQRPARAYGRDLMEQVWSRDL
jgi:DNA-binding MarR family transcriptional regulator/predicted GNAT family acetyltransferase